MLTGLADGLAQEEQRYSYPERQVIRPNRWVPRSKRIVRIVANGPDGLSRSDAAGS